MKIISGKRMCAILEQRGWALARVTGAHHVYRHAATGRTTVVPVHGTSPPSPAPGLLGPRAGRPSYRYTAAAT